MQYGGGLYVTGGARLDMLRTAFIGNNATTSGGAMSFSNAGAVTLTAQTIARNFAAVSGRDIYIPVGSVGVVDCKGGVLNSVPNLFCGGLDGIINDASPGATCNCNTTGASSGLRCSAA